MILRQYSFVIGVRNRVRGKQISDVFVCQQTLHEREKEPLRKAGNVYYYVRTSSSDEIVNCCDNVLMCVQQRVNALSARCSGPQHLTSLNCFQFVGKGRKPRVLLRDLNKHTGPGNARPPKVFPDGNASVLSCKATEQRPCMRREFRQDPVQLSPRAKFFSKHVYLRAESVALNNTPCSASTGLRLAGTASPSGASSPRSTDALIHLLTSSTETYSGSFVRMWGNAKCGVRTGFRYHLRRGLRFFSFVVCCESNSAP